MMRNPVTIMDPFYILPPKLLAACVKILPVANTAASAIEIDASQESGNDSKQTKASGAKETVIIKDVGNFSREQTETFARVQNLKDVIQLGLDMHKWLTCEGIPALPAEYHDVANKVAAEVLGTYPYKVIEGVPNMPDLVYSMLYRATPPTWLTDAAIRALCLRLQDEFNSCRFAGFQAAETLKKRTRQSGGGLLDNAIRDRVFQQVAESGVESVLIPLNFHNAHWCCLVVKASARRIFYYDPLNQGSYLNAAKDIATQLKISGLQEYDLVQQNNPIQFDAFSCGVYVCWMFIRLVAGGQPQDMSANALPRRRFELFYYLLTGRLISIQGVDMQQDDEEEKMPPSSVNVEEKDEEDVPSTQVAK